MHRFIWFGLAWSALAQAAPVTVGWSARVLDNVGTPVSTTDSVRITLYNGGGTEVWQRTYASETFEDGYIHVDLEGNGNIGGVLDSGHFGQDLYVGIKIGTDAELSPTMAIASVPRAAVADTVTGVVRLGTDATCDSSTFGTLRFDHDGTNGTLQICSGGLWLDIATASATAKTVITGAGGVRTWSDGSFAASCDAYRNPPAGHVYLGTTGSGGYRIDPTGSDAFDVHCDMDFESGRGYTRVMVGIGTDVAGWQSTLDLNAVDAVAGGDTFKYSDARINAIPKTLYRYVGTGNWIEDWFWDGACTYNHLAASAGVCNRACHTKDLSTCFQGTTSGGHNGLGDWQSGSHDWLHTSHVSQDWYFRPGDDGDAANACNGENFAGCNIELYVR